ncbi:MAG: hypothetical protein ACD_34C00620G0001, partial [uncultured bacterium]
MANTSPRLGGASAVRPHHEDVITFGRKWGVGDNSLVNTPFRILGCDFDANFGASSGNNFDRSLPVRPAVGAGSDIRQFRSIDIAEAITITIDNTSFVKEGNSA